MSEDNKLSRKDFLKATALAATGLGLSSCILGDNAPKAPTENKSGTQQVQYKWRMVTTWPPDFPILGEAANQYAEIVNKMSNGRIEIQVYGGGELVPALEVFDSVRQNTAEMGCGASYYWAGKHPATQFFAAVPFGMNAQQLTSWLLSGGGYELWKELYDDFGLIPIPAGNTGTQMGGWFNKKINGPADLKGLKMRMPGLGGEVLERAGGAAILVAGGEIYTSLERGVIDATEWVGPYHDYRMGFHRIAKYYYYPGWHEPGTQMEFIINKNVFKNLPADLQQICLSAGYHIQSHLLAQCDAQNATYLQKIKQEGQVEVLPFPDSVLDELKKHTLDVLENLAAKDPVSRKIYDSYRNFHDQMKAWTAISEKAYIEKILEI